jgi:RNA polymerase sigma factor (sigma-70 family)
VRRRRGYRARRRPSRAAPTPRYNGEDDPPAIAVRNEEEEVLRRAKEDLEPLARRLLEGRFTGTTFQALADELGLSDGQARRRFHRALEVLAQEVQGQAE